jgi:hypothetical protein
MDFKKVMMKSKIDKEDEISTYEYIWNAVDDNKWEEKIVINYIYDNVIVLKMLYWYIKTSDCLWRITFSN